MNKLSLSISPGLPWAWSPSGAATVIGEWLVRSAFITKDGSNNVSQINDKYGAIHLTQVGAARPLYQSTGLDSDECVSFNGSSTWIGSTAAAGIQTLSGSDKPFTFGIRCSFPNPVNTAAPFAIDGDAGNEGRHYCNFSNTTLQMVRNDNAGASAPQSIDTSAGASAIYIFSFSGTTLTVFKNGTKIVNAAAMNVGTATFDWITFGCYRPLGLGPLNFSELKFRHAILLNAALSDVDSVHLTDYISRQ